MQSSLSPLRSAPPSPSLRGRRKPDEAVQNAAGLDCFTALAMTIIFLAMTIMFSAPAQAQLEGTDTLPGAACDREGAVRMTANAAGPGAYVLTCDGTEWRATINAELPTANEQVANKEYVDTAVAAGSLAVCTDNYASLCALETNRSGNDPDFTPGNIADGVNILGVTGTFTGAGGLSGPAGCADIGDLCADGTVFAGYHPITQAHLFIPTTDQERPGSPGTFTMNWKNATGTDDINPDSDNDGQANHANRGGAISDFHAFQACEDLSFGGHGDWYLPSRVELYYIWSVQGIIEAGGNITNFQSANYWSSTELNTNVVWNQYFPSGNQNVNNKINTVRVRCVRQ